MDMWSSKVVVCVLFCLFGLDSAIFNYQLIRSHTEKNNLIVSYTNCCFSKWKNSISSTNIWGVVVNFAFTTLWEYTLYKNIFLRQVDF